jgi:hypothetical protein
MVRVQELRITANAQTEMYAQMTYAPLVKAALIPITPQNVMME